MAEKAMTIPRFDFKGCSIKDDAQLQEELDKAGGEGKFFREGKHDVVIKSAEYQGQQAKDPTWGKLALTLQGTGDKEIKSWVYFPTSEITYGGKPGLFMFGKVQAFCAALGEDLKASNLESALKKVFAKPEKLAGRPLSIRVGYERSHAKYAGKNADGSVNLHLQLADGSFQQEGGKTKVFTGPDSRTAYDTVQKYAVEKGLGYDAFAQVVEYFPSEAQLDDCPF